jgi:hypothetical protein
MTRTSRIALYTWAAITLVVAASVLMVYLLRGANRFDAVIQTGPLTNLTITLFSVAATWLLAGFFLFLLSTNRIDKNNLFKWAGFFIVAFVYLNFLRERPEYGDVEYYARAALDLYSGKHLPPEYFYPPFWANFLELFAPYGEKIIFYFAWLFNLISLFAFYFLLSKTLQRYNFSSRLSYTTTTLFLLANATLVRTLFYVQVNLHVLNLILIALLLFRSRPFLSALAMALAVHFKASPAVIVLAFLLELDWKWLIYFAFSMILIAVPTLLTHGFSPFLDFINNTFALMQSHGLSFRDNSFDSFFTAIAEITKPASSLTRILVYASKALLAAATLFIMAQCVRVQTFFKSEERGARLFNAIPPLFILMTLASPIVWEHHGIFTALAFLLLLKKLDTPSEWMWFSFAYLLEFLLPTFDFFPWSYGRLIAPLIILWLMWSTTKHAEISSTFSRWNFFLELQKS